MSDGKVITALIVDDEKVVRDFLSRFLKMQSINVKTVENGIEAVEAVRKEKFTFVFLDICMPKMSGLEAYREIKKIDPGLRCVFMTGYAVEEDLLKKTKQPEFICLKKPFKDIKEIKDIVDDILKTTSVEKGRVLDRRAYARIDVNFEVVYKREGQGEYISCSSRNLSPCGISIFCKEAIPCGKILELCIKSPENNQIFEATGKVVWNKLANDSTGNYEIGIDFTSIDLLALSLFLKQAGIIADDSSGGRT